MTSLALRASALFLALFLLAVVIPTDVRAHGGQFRGPGDQVPPGLREPFDPTPPPPPPPTEAPPSPVTPPSMGGGSTPVTPGVTPGPVTTPTGSGPTRRAGPTMSFDDWMFWYHHNKDDIENLKWALYHPLSSENPLFQIGDERGMGQRGAHMRKTERQVEAIVVPALLWAMDAKNVDHPDIEGAAYIALAKVAREPGHIERIREGLVLGAGARNEALDSAALALGLLRRADREHQFTARELDKVRAVLFGVFENDKYPARTRGFAAISIGLLGDQPTGSGEWASDADEAARVTTARLFDLLRRKYENPDLYVGPLMAIGLQSPESVLPEQRRVLAECALKGFLHREKAGSLSRSYAALALGRVGSGADIRTLQTALGGRARGVDRYTKRSAAIGLGLLGRLVSGAERVEAARVLLRTVERVKDRATGNFALISLAYLLAEDAKAESTDLLRNTGAEKTLLEKAQKGSYQEKGFAALGLGLVVRSVTSVTQVDAWHSFRAHALGALRDGAMSKKLDKKTRAAFCTSLGIAKDERSREMLRRLLADDRSDPMLRSYAALGLGLIGQSSREIAGTVAEAMLARSSEELRRQAATALGLLRNPRVPGTNRDAVDLLIEELREARTQSHKGQIVLALARVGDHRALDELVKLLKNDRENKLTRALACAGLGLVGDLEWIPSLARGSKDINYLASTDLVREFLSIL